MPCCPRRREDGVTSVKLELQMVVSFRVGAGYQIQALRRLVRRIGAEPSPQLPLLFLVMYNYPMGKLHATSPSLRELPLDQAIS